MSEFTIVNRASRRHVALETSLLAHGLPASSAGETAARLREAVLAEGATPAVVGLLDGRAIVGMTEDETHRLIDMKDPPKATASNLGLLMHQRASAGTTVSATLELAADAGLMLFATGGIGGVHRGYGERLDVSADLAALARRAMVVVASGAKCTLDVESTREALETLSIPVIGFRTDAFPAFYMTSSERGVDARMDDPAEIADFARFELARSDRSILVVQPPPADQAVDRATWHDWLGRAEQRIVEGEAIGPRATPRLLAALHEASGGRTREINEALVVANARLAGAICRHLTGEPA